MDKEQISETKLNFFMPQSMRDELERLAREGERPLSSEVRRAIRAHIERNREAATSA